MFICVQLFGYYLNILTSLNVFLIIYLGYNFIYSYYGFAQQEILLKIANPINFSFSISYLVKLILRGVKIKYIIIKKLFKEKKDLKKKLFILILSILLLRYFRT